MRCVLTVMLSAVSPFNTLTAADAPATPDPKATAAAMDGDWVLLPHKATLARDAKMVTWVDAAGFDNFKPLGVTKLADLSFLRFEKGKARLLSDLDEKDARLAVRVESPTGIHEAGFCRVVFEADGKKLTGICKVQGDKLELRVPETCVCAKSGQIAVYQRVGK